MRRKPGRPKGEKKYRVSAHLWLTEEERDGVVEAAFQARLPVATWIKLVVLAETNKPGGDK